MLGINIDLIDLLSCIGCGLRSMCKAAEDRDKAVIYIGSQ